MFLILDFTLYCIMNYFHVVCMCFRDAVYFLMLCDANLILMFVIFDQDKDL